MWFTQCKFCEFLFSLWWRYCFNCMARLRPRPHVSWYFWIRNFIFLDTAIVRTHTASKSGNFLIRSPEWKFLNPITFRIRVAADRRQIASVLLGLIFYAEISYARRRLDICKLFTLFIGQNGRQKQLKRVGKHCCPQRFWVKPGRTSAWWDNFVYPQWISSESEYVWTGEFDMNTLWSRNVWTRIFSYPERKSCGFENIRIRVDGA